MTATMPTPGNVGFCALPQYIEKIVHFRLLREDVSAGVAAHPGSRALARAVVSLLRERCMTDTALRLISPP